MPPRRPRRPPTRFSSIPTGGTFEDDAQLDQLRHPWSLTFGEFLRLAQERYGFVLDVDPIGVPFLWSADGSTFSYLPEGFKMEEALDAAVTRVLCLLLGIPPEDLGLEDDLGGAQLDHRQR